ncbi:MAG: 7,8-didemethyl-8-hydroxy-5-deazariboflavin synthase subunit CofG [Candidatus Margulisiibacteriota bacterium]|jgi:FO synthase subunit 1
MKVVETKDNRSYVRQKTVTYSKAIIVSLTRLCRNKCGYCDYRDEKSNLTVPYQTIKVAKDAREQDCREALFTAGERPDRYSVVRSTLDVWGFTSYIDYVNTICELTFLEGLLPTIDVGYLSMDELKHIRRITASIRMMVDSTDKSLLKKVSHQHSIGKDPALRLEFIRNAGILKVPVTTGIMIGIGESKTARKEALHAIRDIHKELGHIQNVVIQEFVPGKKALMKGIKAPTTSDLLDTIELAREILQPEIAITVHPKDKQNIINYIKAGASDLGSLSEPYWPLINSIQSTLAKKGYELRKRLPIFESFILNKWYSRKLGQIMDRYRLMLKQDFDKREDVISKVKPDLVLA